MPARSDIAQLERNLLDFGRGWEWIVSGQPVVALFSTMGQPNYTRYDRSYLGQPDSTEDGLRLWIGTNHDQDRLLITLTLRIRISNAKKYRLFFLCLAVESLVLHVANPASWVLSDGIVPLEEAKEGNNKSVNHISRLLRSSFTVGAGRSWVIMPKYPHRGPVSAESLSLLRKLKALSEASHFDLFTKHNSWLQQALVRTRSMLEQRVTSPRIDYNKFYPAGRPAVVDQWELQGWYDVLDDTEEDDESARHAHHESLKRKLSAEDDLVHARKTKAVPPPSPPPPYKPPSHSTSCQLPDFAPPALASHQSPAPASASITTHTAAVAAAAAVANSPDTSDFDNTLLEYAVSTSSSPACPSFAPVASQQLVSAMACAMSCSEHQPENTPGPFGTTSPSPMHALTSPSCDFGVTPLPAQHATLFSPIHFARTPEVVCSPVVQVSVCSGDAVGLSRRCISETPPGVTYRSASRSKNEIRNIAPENVLSVLCVEKTVRWLTVLWERSAYAHHICIINLLQLGTALQNSDVDLYHIARASAMATLLEYCAKQHRDEATVPAQTATMAERFIQGGLFEIISWLSILDPEADIRFCNQLSNLASCREDLLRSMASRFNDTKDEHARHLQRLTELKARIVLDACMCYGQAVLDRDTQIAAKMAREQAGIVNRDSMIK